MAAWESAAASGVTGYACGVDVLDAVGAGVELGAGVGDLEGAVMVGFGAGADDEDEAGPAAGFAP